MLFPSRVMQCDQTVIEHVEKITERVPVGDHLFNNQACIREWKNTGRSSQPHEVYGHMRRLAGKYSERVYVASRETDAGMRGELYRLARGHNSATAVATIPQEE